MSVYTTVEQAQLEQFLQRYELGGALSLKPIAAGITNTNYYLETTSGSFVLTLYEHHSDDELDYMLGLQRHLANKSLCCAAPVMDRRGDLYSSLKQRPAAIIHRIQGQVQTHPGPEHCARIGEELARFHLAGRDFQLDRRNPRGIEWLLAVGDMLDSELSHEDRQLFYGTLRDFQALDNSTLPSGAIHADLFHDNALFVGDELSGIIDFDYACYDSFIFDIAVLLNDWCIDSGAGFQESLVTEILDGYQRQRRLSRAEISALPLMLRLGALRFWFSRLYDKVYPLSGELTFIKDPDLFRDMLAARSEQAERLERLFLPHYME